MVIWIGFSASEPAREADSSRVDAERVVGRDAIEDGGATWAQTCSHVTDVLVPGWVERLGIRQGRLGTARWARAFP